MNEIEPADMVMWLEMALLNANKSANYYLINPSMDEKGIKYKLEIDDIARIEHRINIWKCFSK